MKILLSNKFYYPRGGDCIYTIELQQLLSSKAHDVAIFSMQHPENLVDKYSYYWPKNIDYENSNLSKFYDKLYRPFGTNEVKKKFTNLIKTFNPDIIHLNNIHSQLSPVLAEIAYKNRIPLVWTLHDYKLLCPSYHFLLNQRPCELCISNKINSLVHKCIKNSYPASLLGYAEALIWSRKKLEKYTSIFISPSNFLKQKMMDGGFTPGKINVLPNFFPNDKIIDNNPAKKSFYCYIGRISKEKGIETLLRVASQLPDYHLKIIGEGPLLNDLKKQFQASHVEFLGFKPWEEISMILRKSLFSVIPSEWYENNPLSAIESLILGTPILGANIGGIPELIQENKNGLLFKSGDEKDLAEKITMMFLLSKKQFNPIVISSEAKNKYSAENYYDQLIKLYKQIR